MFVRPRSLAVLLALSVPVAFVAFQAGSLSPIAGDALPGLSAAQLQSFNDGKTSFDEEESVEDGLGPIFNDRACGNCHTTPPAAAAARGW